MLTEKADQSKSEVLRLADTSIPVIAIGASASGLEAIEIFLRHASAECGMAFVIIRHLDPVHKGSLVELLQRVTPMPVVQVADRMRINPGHVFVIPPNKDLSMSNGAMHLLEPAEPHGLRLPVDTIFRSMANDMEQRSIRIILSGMGSDGTLGLRAIKEKGGGVFVQDPSTATFDGMPRSAIDAGLADVVASPEELMARITAYITHQPMGLKPAVQLDQKTLGGLEKMLLILLSRTRQDFSLYKRSTIYRRIERRMGIHQNLVLVVFSDLDVSEMTETGEKGANGDRGKERTDILELELKHARDEICTVREEMQSSQEELKSANERPTDLPAGVYVRLSVSDNGRGMDSVTLENIFEPFLKQKVSGGG
ncbi:MAG: hypothetical protein HGB00_08885 [Chlorobiaceae bacterium]|nr:hypothetical protein [Chlorobiaceae bacterium]